jgi:O-methyltransferase involved in polyketide biosynthesis
VKGEKEKTFWPCFKDICWSWFSQYSLGNPGPYFGIKRTSFMTDTNKNYNTISPSAAFIIQLKAYTTIPFAKEAAALLEKENPAMAQYIRENGIRQFFRWLVHFENRYRSIEKLVSETNAKNIIEISSGYSFRGLSMCMNQNVHFMDTDLPDLVHTKQQMMETIAAGISLKGKLELLPLNALDEKEFENLIDHFPDGPVTIINEGLLMYLNQQEKIKIGSIIHHILSRRGGQWITADVYIKKKEQEPDILDKNEYAKRFREEHRIEENKFDDYNTAEDFFTTCGFKITERLSRVTEELSCLQYLEDREAIISKLKASVPDRQTWELSV